MTIYEVVMYGADGDDEGVPFGLFATEERARREIARLAPTFEADARWLIIPHEVKE